jgi:hypothetical protein
MNAEYRTGKFHNTNWNVIHQAAMYVENSLYINLC